MKEQTRSAIKLLEDLTERAKELTCLYAIEEALKDPDREIDRVAERIIQAIPPGWQYPEICVARISLEGSEYQSENFQETSWKLSANILQQDHVVGTIAVYYTRETSGADVDPFLEEEKRLIETIADRINHFLTYRKMKHLFQDWQSGGRDLSEKRRGDWEAVLDLIRQTDNALFLRISNKMLNHLCWSGIGEAEELRRSYTHLNGVGASQYGDELPAHHPSRVLAFSAEFTQKLFRIASDHLSGDEILTRIQMWIQEDKLGALLRTARRRLPLADVVSALRRYFITTRKETDSQYPLARGLKVLLIESILSDRLDYINVAKDHVDIEDLYHLLQKVVFSVESHGRLGGKSAGFFLASQILKEANDGNSANSTLKIPKTWYIPSDMMLELLHYNNMDEVVEQKYKEIERVRVEYAHVFDIFKQMVFPPDMMSGLSMVLDDLGDNPLVVRSSSLLEDRTGFACVDMCKSVFLGNQGTREQRLRSLMQAVAEVYASNFGPEPIENRAERGLLEFSEQIGVLIQEVVGFKVGPYFLPAFSGVARSRNDFQWSNEVEAEDGLVRLIPGLGTRAGDGVNREHPVIVIPGRPTLRLDKAPENRLRRCPKTIDAIHLESNRLQTVELCRLLRDFDYPRAQAEQIVSVIEDGNAQPLDQEKLDYEDDQLVVSFDGLISRSPFVMQIRTVLQTLERQLGGPVEIEFASDGENLYLLQCQSQGFLHPPRPVPIPKEMSRENVVFSANRFVPNGRSTNITHIVYVDPDAYEALDEESRHGALEPAVSRLNDLLPKRQFIFMGPIGPGVNGGNSLGMDIKYSDIKSAAVVVELVKPDMNEKTIPSLGVHSLLDLMDSDIHYLPVFTEDEGTTFNRIFLTRSKNVLPELVPEYAFLSDVVRVVDVAEAANGKAVQVLMNAELCEAVALLVDPDEEKCPPVQGASFEDSHAEDYWRWRYRMAEQIASHLDADRFGVAGLYLFGSTKNGMAGPASDIDLLVHFRGSTYKRKGLVQWLEGWSLCLDEINYLRTGYHSGGLLDVHIVTDDDIARRTSYAVKIDAVTDAARPLKIRDSGRADSKAKRA
jgi:hypothetical protein